MRSYTVKSQDVILVPRQSQRLTTPSKRPLSTSPQNITAARGDAGHGWMTVLVLRLYGCRHGNPVVNV